MPQLGKQVPVPRPRQHGEVSAGSTGSHASACLSGFCDSEEATGPPLIPGIVPVVGVLRLESRAGEGVLSRVLPLRPVGHQAACYGAHLSPSLRTSVHNDTHLDSFTSLITCPLYVTPFGSFPRRHCLRFCTLFVFLILYYFVFVY
jgi:hypothetical protein